MRVLNRRRAGPNNNYIWKEGKIKNKKRSIERNKAYSTGTAPCGQKKKKFEFGVSREAQIVIEAHTVTDSGTAVVFFFFFRTQLSCCYLPLCIIKT